MERESKHKAEKERQIKDFDRIEKQLNIKMKDEAFRRELFSDPVKILKREGVVLPVDKEKSLIQFMENVRISPEAAKMATSVMGPKKGENAAIGISINWDVVKPEESTNTNPAESE
jgi:hypothetical protein